MTSAYSNTRFIATAPPSGYPKRFGIVTACNPDGVPVGQQANEAATEQLRSALERAGHTVFPVTGCSPDLSHREPGYGVLCETSDAAVKLGREWRQEAVFWVENETVHLLPCAEGEPSIVGTWTAMMLPAYDPLTERYRDNLCGRAQRALKKQFTGAVDRKGYVRLPQENLLPGVRLEDFEADLRRGAGDELRKKFCALHSSAALAVNTFAPFKYRARDLVLPNAGPFTSVEFEKALPLGLGGTPPNLDVWLEGEQEIVAIESKFLEYLTPKLAKFKDKYQPAALHWAQQCWWNVKDKAASAGKRYLDVAQLVKHYFGISNYVRDSRRSATLLYLFWEPTNWTGIPACRQHRAELAELSACVTESNVRFNWMTYLDLWDAWSQVPHLASHAANLKARYGVAI